MTPTEWDDLVAQIRDTYPRWPGLAPAQSTAWVDALEEGMRRRRWGVSDLAAGVREHCISTAWAPSSPAELLAATDRAVAARERDTARATPERTYDRTSRYSAEELRVRDGIIRDILERRLRADEVATEARFGAEVARRMVIAERMAVRS